MLPSKKTGLFVAWRIFQRRNTSVAACFDLETRYYYRGWEEKSRLHKAVSYIFKAIAMLADLIRFKPKVVFLQLPPVPVLYIVAAYCRLSGCRYVADCHNVMISSKWLDWPFTKRLLHSADAMLVHNEDVAAYAEQVGFNPITLRDPLPDLHSSDDPALLTKHGLQHGTYIIVPWSFASDEPIEELFEAARDMPETLFVMTWFAEKMSSELRHVLPANLVLTGYLDSNAFNTIFSQAGAALVLTTREGTQPSAASESIALGVPLIISDLNTTRKLYKDVPIYIENSPEGIKDGVITALQERTQRVAALQSFGRDYAENLGAEISSVKRLLGLA